MKRTATTWSRAVRSESLDGVGRCASAPNPAFPARARGRDCTEHGYEEDGMGDELNRLVSHTEPREQQRRDQIEVGEPKDHAIDGPPRHSTNRFGRLSAS